MPGQIVRLTSLTDVQPGGALKVTHRVADRKKVAVLMLLGYEPKDGSEPLDLEKVMGSLGWIKKAKV